MTAESEIILYNSSRSTCSLRVRLTLAAKQVPFVERKLRLDLNEHLKPEFRRLNANALVPVLLVNGTSLSESSAINEFLDDAFPEPPLRPVDLIERARMRAWVAYFDEVTMPALRYLSFQRYYREVMRAVPQSERPAFAAGLPLRKGFWLEMGEDGFSPERLELERERAVQTLERMELALAASDWLAGGELSLADIAVIPAIVRLEDMGLDSLWRDLPAVARWFQRVRQHSMFNAAYYPGSRFDAR